MATETREPVSDTSLRANLAFLLEGPAIAVAAAVALVTVLHYGTGLEGHAPYHDVYRRLYFLPIVYAAARYGLRGGAFFAAAASIAYAPHLYHMMLAYPDRRVDTAADAVLLLVVGILAGALVDAFRRRERLAAIGGQTSRLVHDVRGPLTVIAVGARTMARPDLTTEEREDMAEMIAESAERLAAMSGEVLEYARGSGYLHLGDCSLSQVVEDAVASLRDSLAAAGVSVSVEVDQDAQLQADANRLQRVLANLLRNAAEAMPDGGQVRVKACAADRRAVITVSDNGPGIPPEVAARVFEPFVTHGKAGGTGLGLAIVKEIVTAHGGDIAVSSTPGQGATFTISLPLQQPRGEQSPAQVGGLAHRGELPA